MGAHTDDHSAWLLVEEGVVHSPDLINPDQPPFWHFAGDERFLFSEENLRDVQVLDWTCLSGGRGNVPYREDIDFDLAFIADLKAAAPKAMAEHPFTDFIDPNANAHTGFLSGWISAVGEAAVDALRPKYGDLYGFGAATRPNAEMVAFSLFEHREKNENDDARPMAHRGRSSNRTDSDCQRASAPRESGAPPRRGPRTHERFPGVRRGLNQPRQTSPSASCSTGASPAFDTRFRPPNTGSRPCHECADEMPFEAAGRLTSTITILPDQKGISPPQSPHRRHPWAVDLG